LVLIEVALNAYVLWVNRDAFGVIWKRVLPIVIGLLPGVIVGTSIVTSVSPAWLKLSTYLVLLPLILLQAAGFRRPIKSEKAIGLVGVPSGAALIRQMKIETFRRICMSFDAWIVGFGVSTVLRDTKLVPGPGAYLFLLTVIVVDAVLLYRFFTAHGNRFDLART